MSVLRSASLSALAFLLACGPKPATTPPAGSAATPGPTTSEAAATPRIDAARLFAVVEHLAGDGLGGRYTLSPDIRTSADWLGAQLKASGVGPVGSGYAHDFTLVTGARPTEPPVLAIVVGEKRTEIAPAAFGPSPSSVSGEVEAEVVFVGYAARSIGEEAAYDDLAGLDLSGKIALVLEHQPGQPDVRAFYREMGKRRRAYEEAAEPLRQAGDTKKLAALKRKTVAAIGKLASPWIGEGKFTQDDVDAFSDPATPLDVEGIGARLTQIGRAREGIPTFAGFGRTSDKIDALAKAGAAAVIVVEGPRSFVDPEARSASELPKLEGDRPLRRTHPVPVVHMKWQEADKRFTVKGKRISALQTKIDTKLKPASAPTGKTAHLKVKLEHVQAKAPNVLATIPGGDLAHEIVLFGAHYDHVGRDAEGQGDCHGTDRKDGTRDTICNGADDNASGTAVVVEIARALADAGVKPRRTLVFALFSGEELGLLGSNAMAESLPEAAPFDKGKIVAMVNIDMVGRLRPEGGLAIGGVGSSPGWMEILDSVGNHGMPILYDRAITTRSDHAAFYEQKIPVLFFFTHTHADYHGPGDEAALINKEGMADIAALVQDIALSLAGGHAIAYAPPATPDEGLSRGLPGDNPKTIVKRVGADGRAIEPGGTSAASERATP